MTEKERPSLFVGWVHKGRKNFEVIPESKMESLLNKLFFEKGVHPGAVFISKMTIVHWIAPISKWGYSCTYANGRMVKERTDRVCTQKMYGRTVKERDG